MDRRQRFRELHQADAGFLIPNPWDVGSARLLEALGLQALATTSSGFAATLGRLDGNVTRDEAIEHARALAAATELPVSADLENGFGDAPADVAETVARASAAGLAGCSIEDHPGRGRGDVYEPGLALERVCAAVEARDRDPSPLVLTARAENFLRGHPDLGDTIERLQSFQEAGADVLFAPGLVELAHVQSLVSSVDRPVNVLLHPRGPRAPELFAAGVKRVSIGGQLNRYVNAALVDAMRQLLDHGRHDFCAAGDAVRPLIASAFARWPD